MYDGLAGTLARYHFYYQVRKFMTKPSLLLRSIWVWFVKTYPLGGWTLLVKDVMQMETSLFLMATPLHRFFIAPRTNGLKTLGLRLLQESVESLAYCVLGAQAKTRWSILDGVARAQQTPQVFRKLVEDTVVQFDSTA